MSGKPTYTTEESLAVDSPSDELIQPRVDTAYPVVVRLRLLLPARYIVNGSVTGYKYVFNGSGDIQEIDYFDSLSLLEKRQKTSCCAGTPPMAVFEIVE